MEVTAAVARRGADKFSIESLSMDATPRNDEVLVRVKGVGVCHTDLAIKDGVLPFPLPAVLGHEGSGIVEAVGPGVKHLKPGDAVVMTFASCGHCASCEHERPSYCLDFGAQNYSAQRADGPVLLSQGDEVISGFFFGQSSFSSMAMAREHNLVKIDALVDDAPIELLGPLGCGVQTGAGAVMISLDVRAGRSFLVLGGGAVGLSAVMAAKLRGCSRIIVSEPSAAKREQALALGATEVIDPLNENLVERVQQITEGQGCDYALECTGLVSVMEQAIDSMAMRGQLAVVGVPPKLDATAAVSPLALIQKGLKLMGVIEGDSLPRVFINELYAQFKAGRFPFTKMIHTYPLTSINQAIADVESGVCIKAVLIP
ncbi:TPA: NAD(P)-dependent alcohol dehydrogenase [Pseudomonas aeruginosa]|uniref:NAD(P)-dependent alcohol dehydrogenase n=1 Tax=Pseudomonas aeruginosa TaxID=287 RepID=UPI0004F2E148|nr:NAD(P)-dependent alcohol dehydrogenase [Pseudomonas aeruginosa]EKT9494676.1 NAD(P)-dependent alcohol dehydrogenase [Pseudomonas aeruginosa]MBH4028525.1 NAD(P)-dependent alcohol dehydrogenase [Pseudomonas aeruginosa]MBV5530505.1 NAD(P)-dependent alcohol dehydrogenase [Pseudomonas aeruginosa]MCS8095451.1 NAD(P)-dependent alcohol dehydrogenase [Pseudomonas aeruginosa]RTS98544.1 NAD(P)-dependent alcohol dehydrogenase [Pseudomonas aeruginosa]